jgi:transposase
VLFEDETDLLLFPPLEALWGKRGAPTPVLLTGWNARQVFCGTLDLQTGHRMVARYDRQRTDEFCDFLEILREHYPGWRLLLLLDGHPSHTAEATRSLAEDLDIELAFLPKRSPHLNGMDHLFRRGKQTVSANRQYPDIDAHAGAFMAWVVGLTTHQALTKAAILSKNFWLRDCFRHL